MALTRARRRSRALLFSAQTRWRPVEIAFWLATLLPFVLFPNYLVLASQIAITALFALSLDLILGYAGIVSLGHAAFFGVGAYTAGLISKYGWGEPISGLFLAAIAAGLVGYATSFVICRFRHLALIMLTSRLRPVAGGTRQQRRLADRRHRRPARHPHLEASWAISASTSTATSPTATRLPCCSSCSCSRGGSFIRRSGCRCAASAKTICACPPSARRAARISALSTRSPPPSPGSPARCWRRRRKRCRSIRSASNAPPKWW